MLVAVIGNIFLNCATFDIQKCVPDFSNEPVFSHSSFVYLCKNMCCVVLCLACLRVDIGRVCFNSYLCLWFQLKTIETLLGNTAKVGEVIVLGMITQLKEVGRFLWWSI